MANLTKVDRTHLVFEPFVGTGKALKDFKVASNIFQFSKIGSILLACTQFGAQVIGSDIDFLMVHALTKPSRVGQKKRIKVESIEGNFEQYTFDPLLLTKSRRFGTGVKH